MLALLPSFFLLYFCAPKAKSTSQARIKPKVLSTLGSNPARTRAENPGPTYNFVLSSMLGSNSI